MQRKLKLLGIAFLIVPLISCATPTTPVEVQPVPKAALEVPCSADPQIKYHAPKDVAQAQAWLKGTLGDPKNQYDTPETVEAIRKHNAGVGAVCG